MPMFVLQDTWSNKTLNPGCFGPRFLTFFVPGLSYNVLVDINFFREIEKFVNSASAFGPQVSRHSSINETKNIFLSFFFYNDQVEDTQNGTHNATLNRFVLSIFSPPWFITGIPLTQDQADMVMGQDTLLHGETLFVIPTTDLNHLTHPFFTQSVSSNFCGHTLLIKCTKFVFIVHFNEFLAASGWERDVQLYPEASNCLRVAKRA
ncbi:hypothetical protein mRhiFer1_009574 [Rhinolophus ferrumequinum]|uniref:Uncharacterized protein n=1 Tax=Rhinolophus ferrumequinum TaxID=59479 RepID=A0A7J7ZQI7_RHIFE|nr:hypothetical protein mRhiFer1_009574 [Rhinolophus ferrumequinum]